LGGLIWRKRSPAVNAINANLAAGQIAVAPSVAGGSRLPRGTVHHCAVTTSNTCSIYTDTVISPSVHQPLAAMTSHALTPPDGLPAYRLLTGPDDASFCRRVSEVLAMGYELYGSPAATFNGENVIVAQAVLWPSVGKESR
jgi:hypothetical protein